MPPADVRELLERLAGHVVPDEFVAALEHHTEGNPFFIRETLLHLVEVGRIRFEDGIWAAVDDDLGIPEGVREVIGRRLSQLSTAANHLLEVAALSETHFSLPITAEVAQLDDAIALDALDEALDAQIVIATDVFDHYRFTHALFRQTLADELNLSRRVRLHRSLADAIEGTLRGEPSAEQAASLMRHYQMSAALPGAERGAVYASAVADDAARRYAYRQEFDALTAARDLDPNTEDAATAERNLRAAIRSVADFDLLIEEYERAGERIANSDGSDRAADALAMALAGGTGPGLHMDARLRLGAIARRWLDPTRRDLTWIVLRCLELFEHLADDPHYPGGMADTPDWRELRSVWLENFYEARNLDLGPVLTFNLTREDTERLTPHRPEAPGPTSFDFTRIGDLCTLLTGVRASIDDARARRLTPSLVTSLGLAARIESPLALHDDASAHINEALEVTPRTQPKGISPLVLWAIAGRQVICGQDPPILDDATLEALHSKAETRIASVLARALTAEAFARAGDLDAAIEVLRRCLPCIEYSAGWELNYPELLHAAAGTLFFSQRTDFLETIEQNTRVKTLEPDYRTLDIDGRWIVARLCAVSNRPDEARHWFAEARQVLTESECAATLVAVDYEEAITEARLGHSEHALSLIESARAGCTHSSMHAWHTRLDNLAQSIHA